jgi:uncharacterized protein YndB with AHSA1/START domain
MTERRPTGSVVWTDGGRELTFNRQFEAPVADVWASITESERTERWFLRWWGEPGPGRTITYALTFEEGEPEGEMTIVACDAPVRLRVRTADAAGEWELEARLAEADGVTTLTFVHHLEEDTPVGEVGPGWEYYLDMLVAVRDGDEPPEFDDYYPALADHYGAGDG